VVARGAAGSRRVKSAPPEKNDRAGQNDAAVSRCVPRFLVRRVYPLALSLVPQGRVDGVADMSGQAVGYAIDSA